MRPIWNIAIVLSLLFAPAFSQTPQAREVESAKLSPDQRVYERFRSWLNTQPLDVQRGAESVQKYRLHLKAQGLDEADIEAQVKVVTDRGHSLEVQRWNEILTAEKPRFNTNPNAFLVEMVKARKPGTALDVGMGQGRNAIWLAQNGWTATGFDPADRAVAFAIQTAERLGVHLNTEVTTTEKFDFGDNRWDLILISYVGAREMTEKIERALKPHGLLVIEAYHRDATKGRSIGRGVVFDTGELIKLFPNLRVVRYEEPMAAPDFGQEEARVVRYCAEKIE
jgi:2-polyprenyl-3-methyl-5-hydroxy-6-metoxy-1,4-benzoquinol methylase